MCVYVCTYVCVCTCKKTFYMESGQFIHLNVEVLKVGGAWGGASTDTPGFSPADSLLATVNFRSVPVRFPFSLYVLIKHSLRCAACMWGFCS